MQVFELFGKFSISTFEREFGLMHLVECQHLVQRRKPGFQRTDVKYNIEEERFRQLGDNGEDIHDLSKQPREDSKWKGKTGKNLLSIAVAFGIDRGVLANGDAITK